MGVKEAKERYGCNVPVVFVSGPFRGKNAWEIEQNIRRAEELALEVWKLGVACICPHINTRFFDGVLPDDFYLKGDLAILAGCDILLHTSDWQKSVGAQEEHVFAADCNIRIFESIEDLKEYLNQKKE